MKKTYILLLACCAMLGASAQSKDGYWDNIRTTNETFTLKTGEKKVLKTADFPEGTTEVVYRITVFDDNQKVSSSLVSVLKAIPDPTGISQGAAGAVFLASTISGDDKCKYVVFATKAGSDNYSKTNKPAEACVVQSTPISKEAKLLTKTSDCLSLNPKNLWFVFESDNWFMSQKVVLEVVPWVNTKLSSGWNAETKKELLDLAAKQEVVKYLVKKEQFYGLFLDNISGKYNYTEFKQLLAVERSRAVESAVEASLAKSGEADKWNRVVYDRSERLFTAEKTNEAIDLIQAELRAKNRLDDKGYMVLGNYYLLTKQFAKAEEAYKQGQQLHPTEIGFYLKLAHVYLFTNRLSQAKEIHRKYHNQNLSDGKSWKEQVKADFVGFEKRGLPTANFKKILKIME